jgi:RNA polymerase sigma-70 factor (TIGR02943 family)
MPRIEKAMPANWIENYADSLFSYAMVRVSDREIAKDLVQDTFLSALQNVSSFRGDSSEKTWLTSILKNKIIDYYRKGAVDKTVAFSEADNSPEIDSYFGENGGWKADTLPTDWTESAHESYRSREFHEALQKCLARLTAQCRAVFSLKYLDELEAEEICKKLAVSSSNYWVIMHRAKLMLRRCIEKNWIQA